MDEGERVELVYRATAGEFREALRVAENASAAGRWGRRLLLASGVLGVLVGVLPMALGASADPRVAVMLGAAVLGLGVLPWWQARLVQRRATARGEYRAVVDVWGVRVTHEEGSRLTGWPRMARYAETRRSFVLLGSGPKAPASILLPKRGAGSPLDVERLRSILDRNLTRV
ncbi:hypothetical protein BKI49_11455 [Streptomyces sp. Tue6028]|uniref:hypothetical protein n=1 Tax=Streptomyces sp. Tue6028 TaxID=2036037 RepID=UPI000BB38B29|nr:hypothetical protein [Streptomyces sp. Tue6028]PBC63763.1 hypothetical protein BKI49_11455 [Streptomyces sp. Tue6028]